MIAGALGGALFWAVLIIYVQNRQLQAVNPEALQDARDSWAAAAAEERRELLDDVRAAYANLAVAAAGRPMVAATWPEEALKPDEDEQLRQERAMAAQAIEAELHARTRMGGLDDASLLAERQ